MSRASNDEVLYGALTDEIIAEFRSGRRPDPDELALRYPALAGEIPTHLVEVETILRCGMLDLPTPIQSRDQRPGLPASLGEFRLLREIGRGGMGIVYEAEQPSLRRRVALKVLPVAALLEASRLQRFRHEAQSAALLQHPNIVPVFAVGYDRGIHFYVMQLVEGRSAAAQVAAWREKVRTGPGDRAALLTPSSPNHFRSVAAWGVQAAEALHYAHELGVVHRDVKPANLLLDNRGILWVADFGLARLRGDAELTVTGDVIGSLRYMAPEQALGVKGVVDHRADVYGLGATLYELLTLEPAVPGSDRGELFRRLVRDEPRSPRSINPAIPRDLETVVLKALRREPTARYATAREFADDLNRFLNGESVLARRPTRLERAGRWVRRNPAHAGAALIVLLVTVTALVASSVLIGHEREKTRLERQFAERRLEYSLDVSDKLMSDFGERWLAEQPQLEDRQREYILEALATFEEFARESEGHPALQLKRGRAYRRAGDIHFKLGDLAQGRTAHRRAIALLRALREADPSNVECRRELAITDLNAAFWAARGGQVQEAEDALLEALSLWQAAAEVPDAPRKDRLYLAQTQHSLGMLRHVAGHGNEAQEYLRRARDRLETLAAEDTANAEVGEERVRVSVDLGNVMYETGEPALKSLSMFRIAQQRFNELPAGFRAAPTRRHLEALIYQSLGRQLRSTAAPSAAEAAMRRSVRIMKQLCDDLPKVPQFRTGLADAQMNLGVQMLDVGRLDEAVGELRDAQALLKTPEGISPDDPKQREALASNQLNLSAVLRDLNRLDEADQEGQAARTILVPLAKRERALVRHRKMLAVVDYNLGSIHWDRNERVQARSLFEESRALRRALAAESEVTTPVECAGLAWFLAMCPDPEIRDSDEIANWANKGLRLAPQNTICWLAIGHGYCRDETTASEAIKALERARSLTNGGDAYEYFGLAIAHGKLARRSLFHLLMACVCYQTGCQSMDRLNPRSADLLSLRIEAAALLGF
jgi:serine/threonine protein kinase/tetratricopeptide (TPR) repeat protein